MQRNRGLSKTVLAGVLAVLFTGCGFVSFYLDPPLVSVCQYENFDSTNNEPESYEYSGIITDGITWAAISGEFNTVDDVDYYSFEVTGDEVLEFRAFYNEDRTADLPPEDAFSDYSVWESHDVTLNLTVIEVYLGRDDTGQLTMTLTEYPGVAGSDVDLSPVHFNYAMLKVAADESHQTGRYIVYFR